MDGSDTCERLAQRFVERHKVNIAAQDLLMPPRNFEIYVDLKLHTK